MKSLVVLAYAAVTDTVVHAAAGVIMTWGLLTPAACLGAAAWRRNALARSMTIFLAPGMAFFLLYYFSDDPTSLTGLTLGFHLRTEGTQMLV